MAISIAPRNARDSWVQGGKKHRITRVTLDNSYVTGGWPISKAQLGLGTGDTVDWCSIPAASTGHTLIYDFTNQKIMAFSAMGTELVNASAALNNVVARVYTIGN